MQRFHHTLPILGYGAITAWISGTVVSLVLAFLHIGPVPLQGITAGVLVYAYIVAILIVPVFVLIVTPLVHFVPDGSRLWHPAVAAASGILIGLTAAYIYVVAMAGELILPPPTSWATWALAGPAVIAGAVSGVVCALAHRRHLTKRCSERLAVSVPHVP